MTVNSVIADAHHNSYHYRNKAGCRQPALPANGSFEAFPDPLFYHCLI